MKIWLTTDTHFGHDKLVEFGRPVDFEVRISRGLQQIPAGDMLIHLGDVNMGEDAVWHAHLMSKLKGLKTILVKGNHDNKSDKWYYEHGWDFVCQNYTNFYKKKRILFSHRPQPDGKYDINIHGHFHDAEHRRLE